MKAPTWLLPEDRIAECKHCGAEIWFARNQNGKLVPIDLEAYPKQELSGVWFEPTVAVPVVHGADGVTYVAVLHFATCPPRAHVADLFSAWVDTSRPLVRAIIRNALPADAETASRRCVQLAELLTAEAADRQNWGRP